MSRGLEVRRASGYAMVATAAAGWGTWPFFLRRAERGHGIPASLEAAVAMAVLTFAAGLLVLRDRGPSRAAPRDWLKIAFLGVADALNVVLFFAAYQRTSVAIAVLTHYLTPVLVALAAPLVLHERWHARTLGAVGISSAGLVLLLSPWSVDRHPGDLVGGAFGLASAVCYASNVVVSKGLFDVFSGSELAFFHGLVAVPLMALLAYFFPGARVVQVPE